MNHQRKKSRGLHLVTRFTPTLSLHLCSFAARNTGSSYPLDPHPTRPAVTRSQQKKTEYKNERLLFPISSRPIAIAPPSLRARSHVVISSNPPPISLHLPFQLLLTILLFMIRQFKIIRLQLSRISRIQCNVIFSVGFMNRDCRDTGRSIGCSRGVFG